VKGGECAGLELGRAWKLRLRKLVDFMQAGPTDEMGRYTRVRLAASSFSFFSFACFSIGLEQFAGLGMNSHEETGRLAICSLGSHFS